MSWGTPNGKRRRFSRPVGCLIWLIALIVLLILLSALFGGFQKGTKANGASFNGASIATAVAAP